jgi:hypothetical protein
VTIEHTAITLPVMSESGEISEIDKMLVGLA